MMYSKLILCLVLSFQTLVCETSAQGHLIYLAFVGGKSREGIIKACKK